MSRVSPMLLLALAVVAPLLTISRRAAATDPNNANCKPNRATCNSKRQCCSGFCDPTGLCAAPPTTSTTTTTTNPTTTSTTVTTSTTTTATTSTTTTTTPRFVDNGDGTVTDNDTGLQWEMKDNTCPGIHCVSDTYTWCVPATLTSGCANADNVPDGTAFTSFLATLNGGATGVGNCVSSDGSSQTGGFVNHCDWRLPTIAELRTILDTSQGTCGGGSGACIDATFGPTAASNYWSSTSWDLNTKFVWSVGFNDGSVNVPAKADGRPSVRAVRGGSACTGGKLLDPSGLCVCPTGQTDVGGTCQCPSGQTKCNGNCTDTQTDNNNCGTCGTTCTAPQMCGGGGTPGVCGCTPATSCPAGQNCGTAPDGCGGNIACGTCTNPETCGSDGTCRPG
jgi:uncharacterized protein DUF1566